MYVYMYVCIYVYMYICIYAYIVDVRYFELARDQKFCSKMRKSELSSIRNSGRLLYVYLAGL